MTSMTLMTPALFGRTLLCALSFATLAALGAGPAQAGSLRRCQVNGQTVFQDKPCAEDQPTAAQVQAQRDQQQRQWPAQMQRLDALQAQGVGLVAALKPTVASAREAQPLAPPSRSALTQEEERAINRAKRQNHSDEWYHQQNLARLEQRNALARASNIATEARLFGDMARLQEACGGPLKPHAQVGMSDETFRTCTQQGRFGNLTQVVAVDDHGVPLRLYVYAQAPVRRVYSAGGVVVAVQP